MILTKVRLPSLFSIFLPLSPSSTADPFHLSQQFGKSAFLAKMKLETLREMGATLSPFATAQLLQGLETLSLRMDKHSSNIRRSLGFLVRPSSLRFSLVETDLSCSSSPSDPGLKSHPTHSLFKTHLPRGAGGMLAFGLKPTATRTSHELARDVVDSAKLAIHAPSVGQGQTLIVRLSLLTARPYVSFVVVDGVEGPSRRD
jgi:O-acetylhomoserine/O-acetylserine sulfhydrylase-like pyridoxal-dependent enzyme